MPNQENLLFPDVETKTLSCYTGQSKSMIHHKFNVCLGSCAYGIVFGGVDTRTHRQIATKFVHKDGCLNDKDHQVLEREAAICRRLPYHANVVSVIDILESSLKPQELEELWNPTLLSSKEEHAIRDTVLGSAKWEGQVTFLLIQMEMCGRTLRHWLVDESTGKVEQEGLQHTQFVIVRDICEGLKFLHNNKIMHRDIKPENIMFSYCDNFPLKLGDFGLCRTGHSEATRTATLTSKVGTMDYMAPEVLHGDYGYQCDIFSFGLVAWEVTQLIPSNYRRRMFDLLVYDKEYDVVQDIGSIRGFKESIISMTMRKPNERMTNLQTLACEPVRSPDTSNEDEQICLDVEFKLEEQCETKGPTIGGSVEYLIEIHRYKHIPNPWKRFTESQNVNVDSRIRVISATNAEYYCHKLKDALRDVKDGDTIQLPPHTRYFCPVTITANNATILGSTGTELWFSKEAEKTGVEVLKIAGSGCSIKNLAVFGKRTSIVLHGNDNSFSDLQIHCEKGIRNAAFKVHGDRNSISNCTIRGGDTGLLLKGRENVLASVQITKARVNGIVSDGVENLITDVEIDASSTQRPLHICGGNDVEVSGYITKSIVVTEGKWDMTLKYVKIEDCHFIGICSILPSRNVWLHRVKFNQLEVASDCSCMTFDECSGKYVVTPVTSQLRHCRFDVVDHLRPTQGMLPIPKYQNLNKSSKHRRNDGCLVS